MNSNFNIMLGTIAQYFLICRRLLPFFIFFTYSQVEASTCKINLLNELEKGINTSINFNNLSTSDSSQNKTLTPFLKSNGNYVFVDSASLKPINTKEYKNVTFFNEGIASVQIRRRYGFIDSFGNWLIRPKYRDASIFSEGLCSVRKGKKWGYINRDGDMVIPRLFNHSDVFKNGQASVAKDGMAHKIDKSGKIIHTERIFYANLSNFWTIPKMHSSPLLDTIPTYKGIADKELIAVKINGKYGFQNQDGVLIIPAKYDEASRFQGFPYKCVGIGGKFGIINRLGETIIPIEYDQIEQINDTIFKVGVGTIEINGIFKNFRGAWGAIDNKGKEILKPIYSEIGEVKQGFFQVKLRDSYFFADRIGRLFKEL